MIFRPDTGAMWDPSVLYHDGKYHAFMMYNGDGQDGLAAGHCLLAESVDGTHWQDAGIVNEEIERERGCHFFKCFVGRCGERFIMNHGVRRPEGQDTMRFYESSDLRDWRYLYSSQPDARWYTPKRWDHMYVLPKVEGDSTAGYWGHPVAQVGDEAPRAVGMMQSADGTEWEVLPPAAVDWGDTPPRDLEWGGCERIDERYFLIGGTGKYMGNDGYSMYVFSADDPCGPFRPQRGAYRLCGASMDNVSWLAAWCRGNGELLISNYASMEVGSRAPSMLPLRQPVIDGQGHLRMGWWPGNESLKGGTLSLRDRSLAFDSDGSRDGCEVLWLDTDLDLSAGLLVEGSLRADSAAPASEAGAAGIILAEGGDHSTAIQLGLGLPEERETHIGCLKARRDGGSDFTSRDVTARDCATVNGIDSGRAHAIRLFINRGAFELYVDDLLMQTYWVGPGGHRIGFLARNAAVTVTDLRAWSLSLPSSG